MLRLTCEDKKMNMDERATNVRLYDNSCSFIRQINLGRQGLRRISDNNALDWRRKNTRPNPRRGMLSEVQNR
jgi:hypothetical protein